MIYILNCLDLETHQIKTLGSFDNYQYALDYLLNSKYLEYNGNRINIQGVKKTIPDYQDPDGYYLVQDEEHPKNYYLWKKIVSYGYVWNSYTPVKLLSYQISSCQESPKVTPKMTNRMTNRKVIPERKINNQPQNNTFSLAQCNDFVIKELKERFKRQETKNC